MTNRIQNLVTRSKSILNSDSRKKRLQKPSADHNGSASSAGVTAPSLDGTVSSDTTTYSAQYTERGQWARQDAQPQNDDGDWADKDSIRDIRVWIREKHCLDLRICALVQRRYYRDDEVKEMCRMSDELLDWICAAIAQWDASQFTQQESNEWRIAALIKSEMSSTAMQQQSWAQWLPWAYK